MVRHIDRYYNVLFLKNIYFSPFFNTGIILYNFVLEFWRDGLQGSHNIILIIELTPNQVAHKVGVEEMRSFLSFRVNQLLRQQSQKQIDNAIVEIIVW